MDNPEEYKRSNQTYKQRLACSESENMPKRIDMSVCGLLYQ
jgi:hypothetical protein